MVRVIQHGQRELTQARTYAPDMRLLTRCAVPLATLCVVAAFVTGYFGWSTGLLHLAALYLVAERMRPWLVAKNESAKNESAEHDSAEHEAQPVARVSLDAERVIVHQDPGRPSFDGEAVVSYRWEELQGYYVCPQCLVLLFPDGGRTILPAELFFPNQLQALEAVLESKARRVRVRWLAALRAPLIALALIAAWLVLEVPL